MTNLVGQIESFVSHTVAEYDGMKAQDVYTTLFVADIFNAHDDRANTVPVFSSTFRTLTEAEDFIARHTA